MNPCVDQPVNARSAAAKPVAEKRMLEIRSLGPAPQKVRARLLKMIKENERKRHNEVSSPTIQR